MQDYKLRAWDGEEIAVEESAVAFPDEDDAVFAALELACNYQKVELWQGEALIAYLARTNERRLPAAPKILH